MSKGEFADEVDSAYWSVKNSKHNFPSDTEDPRFMFNRGFYLGAQYAMRTSGELSPHLARFMEFVMWLTERES